MSSEQDQMNLDIWPQEKAIKVHNTTNCRVIQDHIVPLKGHLNLHVCLEHDHEKAIQDHNR